MAVRPAAALRIAGSVRAFEVPVMAVFASYRLASFHLLFLALSALHHSTAVPEPYGSTSGPNLASNRYLAGLAWTQNNFGMQRTSAHLSAPNFVFFVGHPESCKCKYPRMYRTRRAT